MGDRANFGFRQGNDTVYLYGHRAGYKMLKNLATALQRVSDAGRLNDQTYATRIAISELVGKDWSDNLGWGISVNSIGDNEHSIPVVDFQAGTVTLFDKAGTTQKFATSIERFITKYKEGW